MSASQSFFEIQRLADRREPLVIVPPKLAADIAAAAQQGKAQQQ